MMSTKVCPAEAKLSSKVSMVMEVMALMLKAMGFRATVSKYSAPEDQAMRAGERLTNTCSFAQLAESLRSAAGYFACSALLLNRTLFCKSIQFLLPLAVTMVISKPRKMIMSEMKLCQ